MKGDNQQSLIDQGLIPGKKSFEFLSKQIHDNFKWENVHKAMVATNWVWAFGRDKYGENKGTPDITTMKNFAFGLLKQAYDNGTGSVGSGGFTAGWENEELYLTFTLEEYSA